MDVTYFNPNSQKEADFLIGFVARQRTLDFFLRQLRLVPANGTTNHHLIIAPRGFGKTSLLRRIAIGVRADMQLNTTFIALRFREEQHNVISLDVFWRNCLQSLAEAREDEGASPNEIAELDAAWATHAPRQILGQEEQDGEPAWQVLRAHCEQLQRRPLLLIDNLDTLLAGLSSHHQWGLRKRLQSDDGPTLIAAASRYPAATHDHAAAFYEFFRIHPLDKLNDEEVFACLRNLAMHRGPAGHPVLALLDKDPGRVVALNTMAGGNPRTLSVLYGVLESHMSADVLSQLNAMLDTFTGWYQARTEELPIQARAVFDALALNWDPMTAAALGRATGLDTPAVSSQLTRLEKAGYIEPVALSKRRKGRSGYQVNERFFNIWYLMRNGPRRARQSIFFLTKFLQSCFSSAERRSHAISILEKGQSDPGYTLALASSFKKGRLRQLLLEHARIKSNDNGQESEYESIINELRNEGQQQLSTAVHRAENIEQQLPQNYDNAVASFDTTTDERIARSLINEGHRLGGLGKSEQAIDVYDDVLARFGEAAELDVREQIARALVNKAAMLGNLGRQEQTIAVYDNIVARFSNATELSLRKRVAQALFNKGHKLGVLGKPEQAIATYDDVVTRFGMTTESILCEWVAKALFNKGYRLSVLDKPEQAITSYEDVVVRFGTRPELALREQVARALCNKGVSLGILGKPEQAIAIYDDVIARFSMATELALHERVVTALINKGISLGILGKPEQAIAIYDDIVARLGTATEIVLREGVARALVNKGVSLGILGKPEQAIAIYDDVIARFGTATEPALRDQIAMALHNKGFRLGSLDKSEQAIAVYDEIVARFGTASEPFLRERVARALLNKGSRLAVLDKSEQAITVYDDIVTRFGTANELALRAQVAIALVNKGVRLASLDKSEQAITVYDDIVTRFGTANELALRTQVAIALVNKGGRLAALNKSEQAIAVYNDVVARLGTANEPTLRTQVARALVNKGDRFSAIDQSEQAIVIYDDVVARFGTANELAQRVQVAKALHNKGIRLGILGQSEQAVAAYDDVIARFGAATEFPLREWVAKALYRKGIRLGILGQSEQEIEVYDNVVARFGGATEPALHEWVAVTLISKGAKLEALDQPEQAIVVYDDVIARFGIATEPAMREWVSGAFERKAFLLCEAEHFDASKSTYLEAIKWDSTIPQFHVGLGNLLLDFTGEINGALAAFQRGLETTTNPEGRTLLHANIAYAIALHDGDHLVARMHANSALEDETEISPAGRRLLEALPIWSKSTDPDWPYIFEHIGKALTSEDPALWTNYGDDMQRILWFVLANGQGADFKRWMISEQFQNQYAPLYHAFVAALEGDDHLLQINPETRQPAQVIHAGIVRRAKLWPSKGT